LLLIKLICVGLSALAMNSNFSMYDPIGVLSVEEKSSLEQEGFSLVSERKVNGREVRIQIDFLNPDEFDEGGTKGRNADGTTIFSEGTYFKWGMDYFSEPAVLILFVKDGSTYQLKALNFSDMMMDEGIPDLVRRYIRDEIMLKENSYYDIIDKGLYAISEALNPIYKQRLEAKGLEMLNTDDRYKRGHCVYGDCKYYEFVPGEESVLGPVIPKTEIEFKDLPETETTLLQSTINKIMAWGHTHANEIVSNWPWERNGKYLFSPANTEGYQIPEEYFDVKKDNPWSILTASQDEKSVGELLPTMAWLEMYGWRATYCNFFAQDLSNYIFGFLPWEIGRNANDIHEFILSNEDFIEIEPNDLYKFISKSYICYFTQKGSIKKDGTLGPGHIATSWINEKTAIQAGDITNIVDPLSIFNPDKFKIHLYLGFLKKE